MTFIKGQIPWNKGLKIQLNSGKTHFKKGHIPWDKGTKGVVTSWNKGKKYKNSKMSLLVKSGVCGMTGRRHSKESREKISMAHMGIKHTEKSKKLISLHNKTPRGKDNPHWKGGKGTERHRLMNQVEYIAWRSMVFERDNYTCQDCGAKGVYLMAHHIKPWRDYPQLRYDTRNGITFCKDCHAKNDKYFGIFLGIRRVN